MMNNSSGQDSELVSVLAKGLNAVLHDYQILHARRSFTNEIVDFDIICDSQPKTQSNGTRNLSDYRLLYVLRKIFTSNHHGEWISLYDRMLVTLAPDVVLVVPFDAHRHAPFLEHISLVLGFNGFDHIVTESISQRMITNALEKLVNNHQPFAFGFLNIDNHSQILSEHANISKSDLAALLRSAISSRLDDEDTVEILNDNECAIILECKKNIEEVLPRLWELSNLSNTHVVIDGTEINLQFSAGYVLVTDFFTTAKEILDEAISMMYKSKNNGKNGYFLSDSYHSANDPSL